MHDLLTDAGVVLVVMTAAIVFAVMLWAGSRVHWPGRRRAGAPAAPVCGRAARAS